MEITEKCEHQQKTEGNVNVILRRKILMYFHSDLKIRRSIETV